MIHDSILETIGRTPVVRLHRLAPAGVQLYAKVEAFNPGGSVKDRLALAIILDAEARGELKPGDTVVEATSGNTGIALAMVCAARGYPFVAVMSDSFSIERRKLMRAYGARVILTPAAERGTGMVRRAEQLAREHGWFLARQFENPANPAYHRETTAAEILSDFAGRRLDPRLERLSAEAREREQKVRQIALHVDHQHRNLRAAPPPPSPSVSPSCRCPSCRPPLRASRGGALEGPTCRAACRSASSSNPGKVKEAPSSSLRSRAHER